MENNYRLTNKEVVAILKEVLAAMEVKNVNIFKIRAYQNAIAVIDNLSNSVYDIWENKRLDEIPSIGTALAQHLNDLFTSGTSKEFEQVKFGLPEGMFSLIGIRGIGAKKAFKLAHAFKLVNREKAIEDIKERALKGEIKVLDGFGEKSEKDILEAIEQMKLTKNEKPRTLLVIAEQVVERVIEHMHKCDQVLKIDALGSFRRRNPTIGDLDFVVATNDPEKVMSHFLAFDEVSEVLVKGDKKVAVVLKNDMQADLRVSAPQAYGAMLQYNTGSKQHNIVLRTYALDKGMSLNEYGIKINGENKEFATEEAFYKKLGLPPIPPELRHGANEVELASKNKLPKLIELKDIKGDCHTHTTDSDGENTMEEMLTMASKLKYEYYGISDHAPSIINRGEEEVAQILVEKRKRIDSFNKTHPNIKVFFGYEVNILAEAKLALPDEYLKMLDYVVASIHTSFTQDRDQVTKRLVNALENPYVNIIGHPAGGLLNERDPIDPDWNKVFDAAKANNKILEINAQPNRLDLSYDLVAEAIKRGIKIIINSDAHSINQLLNIKYGIDVARRGGCEAKDVINTYSFEDFKKAVSLRNW